MLEKNNLSESLEFIPFSTMAKIHLQKPSKFELLDDVMEFLVPMKSIRGLISQINSNKIRKCMEVRKSTLILKILTSHLPKPFLVWGLEKL